MIGSIFSHHEILKKHFIMPLKSNRKVALSRTDKRQGKYQTVETLVFKKDKTVRGIYLEGVDFPLLLAKQVFVNEYGSIGVLYLVTSDTTLTYERMTTLYRTRWHVEEYHKSLKHMNHSFSLKAEHLQVSTHDCIRTIEVTTTYTFFKKMLFA